jgi:membrane-associated PAP2 superfamily phosphatase
MQHLFVRLFLACCQISLNNILVVASLPWDFGAYGGGGLRNGIIWENVNRSTIKVVRRYYSAECCQYAMEKPKFETKM